VSSLHLPPAESGPLAAQRRGWYDPGATSRAKGPHLGLTLAPFPFSLIWLRDRYHAHHAEVSTLTCPSDSSNARHLLCPKYGRASSAIDSSTADSCFECLPYQPRPWRPTSHSPKASNLSEYAHNITTAAVGHQSSRTEKKFSRRDSNW
jgi:hypothetical protein